MKPYPLASLNHFTVPLMRMPVPLTQTVMAAGRDVSMTGGLRKPYDFWYQPVEDRFPRSARATAASSLCADYAAPAMYLANRPQVVQRSVTWQRGGGGLSWGSRSIEPE